jgi:hypothetical protein
MIRQTDKIMRIEAAGWRLAHTRETVTDDGVRDVTMVFLADSGTPGQRR